MTNTYSPPPSPASQLSNVLHTGHSEQTTIHVIIAAATEAPHHCTLDYMHIFSEGLPTPACSYKGGGDGQDTPGE